MLMQLFGLYSGIGTATQLPHGLKGPEVIRPAAPIYATTQEALTEKIQGQ